MKKIILSLFFVLGVIVSLTVYSKANNIVWPPQLNDMYPDSVEYYDQTGKIVKMSDFKGDVLFIEYVGMNCPACQAFSGANKKEIGSFENNAVQAGLQSIEEYFNVYVKGVKFSDKRMVYIAVLLYDLKLGVPTAADAKKWADHFKLQKNKKQYVLVPKKDMRSTASFDLIPGFQLVDKNFILRSDSTGHRPKEDLYQTLLPMVSKIIGE
jgi:hypothetical protein